MTTLKNEQTKKVETDLSNAVVGAKVEHKKFGEGKIASFDKAKKYVRIAFTVGEKTFVFPNCFEMDFLRLK